MFINKRILLILGILGVLIVGGLGVTVLLLLTHSNASASNTAVTPAPTLTVTPGLTANRVCATGVITSINAQGQSFVVTEKGVKTVTVTTDSQTTFHKRGMKSAAFSALSVGEHVRITSQSSCDSTATTFAAKTITIVVPGALPGASPTATP